MLERPLLIPLGSLVAGLCTADLLEAVPPLWALWALLVTTLAACFVTSRLPFLLSSTLLFFVWGALSLKPFLEPFDKLSLYAADRPVLIQGTVERRSEGLSSGGGRVYVNVDRLSLEPGERAVTGKLLVYIKEGRARLATGDRILFQSKIRKPRMYGLPGEMDYPRRLAYQGVFATGFVAAAEELVLIRAGDGWRHDIDLLSFRLGDFIRRSAPGVEGAVLKALLLGDKGDIPEELNEAYARSGVNHILSISGFHVGILFLCIFHFLFLLARRSEFLALHLNLRRALLVVSLPVVIFYLFLSGAASATVRSVLMIAAFTAAIHLKREMEPVNSVMLAASIILFSAPETFFDVSFQLSFLAIWGLVVLAPPLAAPFAVKGRKFRWLALLIAASAAAILATLVPVAYYFHRVSFIGLLSNLVIVPLMGYGAVVAGFVSLPLSFPVPEAAGLLVRLAAYMVTLSDTIVLHLARAPVLTGYAPGKIDIFIACLALCAATFPGTRRRRLVATAALLVVLAVRAVPAATAGDGTLQVYFLSVGQGDASLVRLPDGKWMMVDGGGRAGDTEERVGERLLLPTLASLGVGRIDFLVLTHEHPDHLQGVLYIAQHYEVGELWESGVQSPTPEYQELKWLCAARGIPVRRVTASVPPFAAGNAVVEPLWPLSNASKTSPRTFLSHSQPSTPARPEPALRHRGDLAGHRAPAFSGDANESSLVFRLRHGRSSVLFTGDLGAQSERELMEQGKPLRSTILKVGHHGSRYASTDAFLSAVSPKAAVISAGFKNPFHLPAGATLMRLQRHGIRVYRTDLDGTVKVVCGAEGDVTVSTPWGHFN